MGIAILQPHHVNPQVRLANYFDVPPGSVWGKRVIEDPELILIYRGAFRYVSEAGHDDVVRMGDVLWIEPAVPHIFSHVPEEGPGGISCIHCEMTDSGTWSNGDYRLDPIPKTVTHVGQDGTLHDLFYRTAENFLGKGSNRNLLISTIVKSIWIRLCEHWAGQTGPRISPRIDSMLKYINTRLADPISRLDLSREFGLTPQHVNYLFKRELGLSPTQYIHRQRIVQAWWLLQQKDMKISEIAQQVGFPDVFYFSKLFKKNTGLAPSQVQSRKQRLSFKP